MSTALPPSAANDLERPAASFTSFLLHLQPLEVHRHTLRPLYTLGLGLISFFLFVILAVTGVLLMFYYVPSPQQAYERMLDLRGAVAFGPLVRNMHRWAAHAMVTVVFLHMSRVFFTGAYKKPREFNWVLGVFLLLATLFHSFTGYLLPWDQPAFWAITVGASIAGYAPLAGAPLKYLLLGGANAGPEALLRFYVLHVALLPAILTLLIAVHFWRIRKAGGLSRPPEIEGRPGLEGGVPADSVPASPHLLVAELFTFVATLTAIAGLALLFNAPLAGPVNLTHPPNPAKAPWFFLGVQEMVSYSAFWGGVAIPALAVALLLLTPYLDRSRHGGGQWFARGRLLANTLFLAFMLLNVAFIIIGKFFRGPNWAFVTPW